MIHQARLWLCGALPLLLLGLPAQGEANDDIDRLIDLLRFEETVAIMRLEGLEYGAGVGRSLLSEADPEDWGAVVSDIYDAENNLVQSMSIHTSCSSNLFIGDIYGNLELTGFTNDLQGTVTANNEVELWYTISNTGGPTVNYLMASDDNATPSDSGDDVLADNPIFDALNPSVVTRTPVALNEAFELVSGVTATLFPVPGKVPLYLEGEVVEPARTLARMALREPKAHAVEVLVRVVLFRLGDLPILLGVTTEPAWIKFPHRNIRCAMHHPTGKLPG